MLTLKIIEISRKIKIYFQKRKKKNWPIKVVALTANGISQSAGIPDYEGTWNDIPVRDILTRSFAEENKQSYEEYCQQTKACCEKEPTLAHKALAKAGVRVITQNIDRLHQKAGSDEVIELHGNLWDGLVLFDEEINDWWKAIFELRGATHLLVIGCNLNIMPAGMLPEFALEQGVEVINIETDIDKEVPAWLKKMQLIN